MNLNRVTISGRLTRDPELKMTTSQKEVCTFTVAVNRRKKPDEEKPTADFIQCVVWGQTAVNLCRYQKKGDMVEVDGRIQTRKYDDKDGKTVYVTEVVANDINYVGGSKPADTDTEPSYPTYLTGGDRVRRADIDAQIHDITNDPVADLQSDDLPF